MQQHSSLSCCLYWPCRFVLQFLQNTPGRDSCDLPLTNCSKSDLLLEDFDSYQNQTWILSLKNSKVVCVPFLILFCSRAEHSDLTEEPFSRPQGGQGWVLPWAGVRFPACSLASPSILSLVPKCPGSSRLKPPQREQGISSTIRCCRVLGQSNSELFARCEVGMILNLGASATYSSVISSGIIHKSIILLILLLSSD